MLVLKCRVLPFSWALTLLACCLGLRGSCPVVTLPGVPVWFFRTWWGSVELLRTPGGRVFLSDWVFHVWVFSGSPSGSGCSVLCFRHGCDVVLRDLPCSSVGGLHCTGPANARQIAWEKVIACGGGQVFLVRLGRRIVDGACRSLTAGCKVGSSISVSFWLRMPGHGGAGSRSRIGLFCVPWARCTRAVAPCLLCEELAVILVIGGGCGASAHPCEASASGLWSLGSSLPSTRPVGGGAGPGLTRSCSPGHIPGPWAWLPRLSPAVRLPSRGWLGAAVCVCLHFLKCCLYCFLKIWDLIS